MNSKGNRTYSQKLFFLLALFFTEALVIGIIITRWDDSFFDTRRNVSLFTTGALILVLLYIQFRSFLRTRRIEKQLKCTFPKESDEMSVSEILAMYDQKKQMRAELEREAELPSENTREGALRNLALKGVMFIIILAGVVISLTFASVHGNAVFFIGTLMLICTISLISAIVQYIKVSRQRDTEQSNN